jgi:hypothetical protein
VFGSVDFSNFGRESILKNDALCDARDGILNTPASRARRGSVSAHSGKCARKLKRAEIVMSS